MRAFLTLALSAALSLTASADDDVPEGIVHFLELHCLDCHDSADAKGDLSLEDYKTLDHKVWQNVLEQIATDEMPPKKKKTRGDGPAREKVVTAIFDFLTEKGANPSLPGGPLPEDGNLVDHERLFSGRIQGPASSPPRFWRRSQSQYDNLMEQLWVIPKLRYEKSGLRDDPKWAAYSYSKPFPQLHPDDFTNYSGEIHADEATLRSLMNVGAQIAERLTAEKPTFASEIQPWKAVGASSVRRGHPWERFKIEPPKRAEEFEPFLTKNADPSKAEKDEAIRKVFQILLGRVAGDAERKRYAKLLDRCIERGGPASGLRGLITAVIVSPEFVFTMEMGLGPKDKHGRRMLSSNELVYAINNALTDISPDTELLKSAAAGKLKTKKDVEREVRRILSDESIEKTRRLRFFQEFFGYSNALSIFKDKPGWNLQVKYLVRDADMLVEHILKKDKNVFSELLTTDRYFVAYPAIDDPELFEAVIQRTREETLATIEKTKKKGKKLTPPIRGYNRAWILSQGLNLIPRTVHNDPKYHETAYVSIYGFDLTKFDWTPEQPIKVPGKRAGLLTHPAWLVAHSTNFDNDVVGRGHWIRERLLAGKIPNIPIEVEAMVPEEPDSTLRHRMRVTTDSYCLRCHTRMDPLGFPFEIYDHFGHYRTEELVGSRKNIKKTIDSSGEILHSGESELDAPVDDAIDLVHKLSNSSRVRQSFVRHAFRFWMGRNETLQDSPTLIAADKAYLKSGGSFNELLVSLLTSDSFLYRK